MSERERLELLRRARRRLLKTSTSGRDFARTKRGSEWKAAFELLERLERELEGPKTPALGPVLRGGRPLGEERLTHPTGGLEHYPAFDAGFGDDGRVVLAPELVTVTRHSSARRRDGRPNGRAFYATGASGLKYWFGHVEGIPAVGARIGKGRRLAVVSANHEVPHLHLGVDARTLIGRELELGKVELGAQLARTLG